MNVWAIVGGIAIVALLYYRYFGEPGDPNINPPTAEVVPVIEPRPVLKEGQLHPVWTDHNPPLGW